MLEHNVKLNCSKSFDLILGHLAEMTFGHPKDIVIIYYDVFNIAADPTCKLNTAFGIRSKIVSLI